MNINLHFTATISCCYNISGIKMGKEAPDFHYEIKGDTLFIYENNSFVKTVHIYELCTSNSGISIKFIDNEEIVNNTGFINLSNLEFFLNNS